MLSSAKHQRDHRLLSATTTNKNKKRSLTTTTTTTTTSISSSSTSLSTSSSSSSSPLDSQANKRSLITMEEVWKDINLSSFHHLNRHSQHHPQHNHEQPRSRSHSNQQSQNPNSIFQDFLHGPLNQEPTSLTMASASNGDSTTVTALFSPPLPPPATVLSLNSGAGFEFLDNQDPLITPNSNMHSHRHLSAHVTSFNTPFESLVTSDCFGKKRSQENEGSGNRRHKRMIKNRESAARSRARKQAYTNELELEVAHLQAENARLRKQQEQDQLKMAAANQQPKKNTLQRSNTAPF